MDISTWIHNLISPSTGVAVAVTCVALWYGLKIMRGKSEINKPNIKMQYVPDETDDPLTKAFHQATSVIQKTKIDSTDTKLKLYGLFKCATVGPAPAQGPSLLEGLEAKAKHSAWAEVGQLSKQEGMKKYIDFAKTLCPNLETLNPEEMEKPKEDTRQGFGPVFSRMEFPADLLPEKKTPANNNNEIGIDIWTLDLMEERDTKKLKDLITSGKVNIDEQNEDKLSLLMSAADVENVEFVEWLLTNYKPNVNLQDSSGETALHYAIDNVEITQLLLDHGADPTIQNESENTPYTASENSQVKSLLQAKMG